MRVGSPSFSGYSQSLSVIFFASAILYFGQALFIPLFFGLIAAIILYPACQWLEDRRWPRGLAIATCLFLVFLLMVALSVLLLWQITAFHRELPALGQKLTALLKTVQDWVVAEWHISLEDQMNWLQQGLLGMGNQLGGLLVGTVNLTVNFFFFLIIVPLFTVLFLYYRQLLSKFLYAAFRHQDPAYLREIVQQTVLTYHHYICGLAIIYFIVGVLNSLGLFLLGIEHALLFGFLASILTIIPYVGITIGSLLPITLAWLTYDNIWYPFGVIGLFVLVQYLEANLIFPWIVGTQLRVNMLATLAAMLAGGVLWGLSGVILFLPFVAILKLIADRVPQWQALRILLSPLEESVPKTPRRMAKTKVSS
jgi:predicted PurR-regulated permease PerM